MGQSLAGLSSGNTPQEDFRQSEIGQQNADARTEQWIGQSDAIQQRRMDEASAPYREQQWIAQSDAIQAQRLADVSSQRRDEALAMANFNAAAAKVYAAEDAQLKADALAAIPGQNARADAYRSQLAQQRMAQQQAYWDSLQAGAWSGRTGTGGPAWNVGSSTTASGHFETAASYDAFSGAATGGTEQVWASDRPMSYGQQMQNVGRFSADFGIGTVKGLDNLIPETAAFMYRMTGYAAAGVTSLVDTDVSDRMFAQYSRVTGRIFDYDNGVQQVGGITAQLAAPTLVKGFTASGSALYDFEQSVKTTINYDYRHYFSGTTVLDSETTFYSYKNSAYFTPGVAFEAKQLWLTPDLMTSEEAVQRLALPFPKGYDTLLTVTLPEGTTIMTPRSVWSLFGKPGGGLETRVYAPVTSDMYGVSAAPTKIPR